jgi:hypothetical protein
MSDHDLDDDVDFTLEDLAVVERFDVVELDIFCVAGEVHDYDDDN